MSNKTLWVENYKFADDGWARLFPMGARKRDDRVLDLSRPSLSKMVKNFKSGSPQFKPPLNREHKSELGREGVIVDMEVRDDGLYAKFDDAGARFLGEGKFGYLSPEIQWQQWQNPVTGEYSDGVIVGVGATNYPYFGEDTVLFSIANTEPVQELDMKDKQEEFAATDADIETEVGQLHRLAKQLKRFFSPEQVEEIADAAKGKADDDGKSGDKKEKASARQNGDVYNMNVTGVDVEKYAALEAQVKAQADQYAAIVAENKRLAEAVAAEQYRVAVNDMRREVDKFGALTFAQNDRGETAAWLYRIKAAVKPEDFAALTETLRANNEQAKTGALFSRHSSGQGVETDEAGQFDAEVARYMAENKVSKSAAIAVVAEAKPELYNAIRYREVR